MSPTVRRMRLAAELAQLRAAAGLSPDQVAAKIGYSRAKVSRLENGRERPKQADVVRILETLAVEGEQWSQLIDVARDAASEGWWVSYSADMGARQALYADLEADAASISEFQPFIPGLLQTPEYAAHRQAAESEIGPVAFQSARAVEARQARQKMLLRHGGPAYEVVIDEIAFRRLAAPPDVVANQIDHIGRSTANPRVTVKVLPVTARVAGYVVARSAFSWYRYADLLDPQVVAVDTVTSDSVLTTLSHSDDVARYVALYERLAAAALPVDDSIAFLEQVARELRTEGAVS